MRADERPSPSRCDVRRASVEDAHVVHAVRQRAIRGSAAGLYDSDALEAWASGGSEAELRRKIETTAAFVAVVDGQVIGWGNFDGAEVDQLYVDPTTVAWGWPGVFTRRSKLSLERMAYRG